MDLDLRAPLIAAGGAAVFSALVGLVAGVPFGVILLRALLGGLFFGALVYGGLLALKSIAPELFSGSDSADFAAAGGPGLGGAVDIVLDDEEPGPLQAERAGFAVGGAGSGVGVAGASEAGHAAPRPRGAEPEGAYPASLLDGGHEEGVAADEGPGGVAAGGERRSAAAAGPGNAADEVEDAEDLEEGLSDGIGGGALGTQGGSIAVPPPGASIDELDSLPDLDGFSESFGESATRGGSEADGERRAPRPSPAGGARAGMDDPAALAQAVRTLLKRDQKG